LRSLLDITDSAILAYTEAALVTEKAILLFADPHPVVDSLTLFSIHYLLFQNICAWAGQPRMVEFSKDGFKFCRSSQFKPMRNSIDVSILLYSFGDKSDKSILAKSHS
jgi:fido (protein-threonine AMPylation protein)